MYEQNDHNNAKPSTDGQTQLELAIIELQKYNSGLDSIATEFNGIIEKLLPETKRELLDSEQKQLMRYSIKRMPS